MSLKTATIQARPYKSPPFSVQAPGYEHVKGETIPRRHPLCVNGLASRPEKDIATVFDIFLRSSEKYGDLNAVGSREVVDVHTESKTTKKIVAGKEQETTKNWTFYQLSEYHYLTFREYKALALQVGAGYRKLGLSHKDKLHIFAATR